jgi:polar amino acid transport system permease protein
MVAAMNFQTAKFIVKWTILAFLAAFALLLAYWLIFHSQWWWLPEYLKRFGKGLWLTMLLLVLSCVFGMMLAVPIGLVQVTGPRWLAKIAEAFCTVIRGTPLLVQLWLLYFGLGPLLFDIFPAIRQSFLWPVLRDGFAYAVFAFTLSFAGYEGEVMRGAFLGVPKGELEAARACGMSPFLTLRRVWFPRAVRLVLPTLAGETVLQLQATPIAFKVAILDLMGVVYVVRQDKYLTFEPLLFIALIYVILTFILTRGFNWYERRIPQKR